MLKIRELINYIENLVPLWLQENYDNSGLLLGNSESNISSVLICLDVTENVIKEAISKGSNFIISHHPLIFSPLKKITGNNYVERCIMLALANNISIYALHTNLDNIKDGVNAKICQILDLEKIKILSQKRNLFKKIVTFVPKSEADRVREAIFEAGAGEIGNYDSCSFNTIGEGTFRANEYANPYVGEKNILHYEEEVKIETIFPVYRTNQVIKKLLATHPYEEVAYDIYSLENAAANIGAGMIGEMATPMPEKDFLNWLKEKFNLTILKHSCLLSKKIKRVAVCGGSGSFLIKDAINERADVFITADINYHHFYDAENKILLIDIGHYESEIFTKNLIFDLINKKFNNIALKLSETDINPVSYF